MQELIDLQREYTTAKRMMMRYYNQSSNKIEYEKGHIWREKCIEIRQKIDELKSKQN